MVPTVLAAPPPPAFLGVMPKRKVWPFDLKLRLWRAEAKKSLSAVSRGTGIAYATLHGWAEEGVRAPADGLDKIARFTGLPASYWMDTAVPYPPPTDYFDVAAEVNAEIRGLTADRMQRVLEMLRSPGELDRAL